MASSWPGRYRASSKRRDLLSDRAEPDASDFFRAVLAVRICSERIAWTSNARGTDAHVRLIDWLVGRKCSKRLRRETSKSRRRRQVRIAAVREGGSAAVASEVLARSNSRSTP